MKKLTLVAIALLASVVSFALNPFAYGLSSSLSDDGVTLTVNYSLNANAKAVNVVVLNGEEVVATIPCDGIAKGDHSVQVSTVELPKSVALTWKVEVNGNSVDKPTQEATAYSLYCPHGLAIDKDPESDYFGRILVADAMQIVKDKAGYLGSGKGAGLYVFAPDFTNDGKVYNGGLDFTRKLASNGYQPYRVKISEDGRIFVSSLDLNGVVVWEVSKDLQTWTPVIAGTNNATDHNIYDAGGNFVAGLNCSMDVTGKGEDLKLLLYSTNNKGIAFNQSGYRLDEYALGTATTWTGTPKNIINGGKYGVVHTNVEWIYDGEGGYWFGASRDGNDGQPNLVHINAEGVEDYRNESNTLYGGDGVLVHNGMLFKGKARTSGTVGNFGVWTIGKDADGKVTLTEKWSVVANGIGRNLNEFAVDYAENLYVVGNSNEKIIAYALPYSGTVETPAASKYAFQLEAPATPEPVEMVGVVKRALQVGESVVVLTHEADGTPHIYNMVGETITEVSQEGVVPVNPANEYDYLSISDIALTDDGKLVACNYIRCAAADPSVGTTRYYIWNDLAEAPALWFTSYKTGNSTLGDVGYTFAVKGVSTNAQVMTTAVHNKNRAARINLHTIVNGVEETSKYHRFGLHTTDSYFTEAKRGVQFQLSTTPLDGTWAMDGDLANPAGFTVPSDVNAGYVGTELPAEVVLGKKYNGASYVTCLLKELMVAPYADAEGKLTGVKVIDITAGFATAKVIKEANLDAPVAATAAATAVAVAENVLTVTLVADAEVHTLTIELDTKAETHTITATANIEERGYIEGLENEGVYEAGDEVILRAVANDGYEFVDWSNGSTDNPLTFVVKKDENLVANFRPVLASSITLNALPLQDYSTSIVGTIKRAIQNGENTIVLTHEADGTPHIYNVAHATKTVTEISQEGVVARDPDNVGDYLSISDIALTDDGKLVACNYIRCQNTDAQVDAGYKRGTNRFYIWDELTGAAKEWFTEQFAGNSYRADAGYTMALKGSSTDCNVLVTVRHYNAAGAGGSDGSVRMHYFTIAGGAKTSRIYLGWTIEPTAPYYTHTIGENMLLSSSPIATMNFIMDANLTVPSEFQVIGDAKDVTILGRMAADSVSAKYNGASCLPNYNEHHLLLTPYANEEGNLAGVKVLDIADGLTGATELITNTDLATAENSTAAAATAVVDAEGKLTIHLFADAKVYTFTQKEQGPATAIDNNTVVAPQVDKILRNGQVLIIRDGKTYNMVGQEVK